MSTLDVQRHAELFKPHEFNTPIHIIGVGATGSWLALMLAKLGITDITVWDFDKVEEHNIANQAYRTMASSTFGHNVNQNRLRANGDIGVMKVEALKELVYEQAGEILIKSKQEAYTNQRINGIVFMMIDTMEGRQQIWKDAIKLKSNIDLLIEPRMGLSMGRIYNVIPTSIEHCKQYEDTFYSDDDAEVSACGTSVSVITSAMHIASICARQVINFHNEIELDNEILVDMMYNNTIASKWGV